MENVIVSFTSYPARIGIVPKVLDSIVKQTILPDKIILYLYKDEFVKKNPMPDFSEYYKYGFEIYWCNENLGPHKKYYYSIQKYPDSIVITIDDDICYGATMIEELLDCHKQYPKAVITRRAHLVTSQNDGTTAPYNEWYQECDKYIGIPRMDLVSTGCMGVLYPPGIFDEELLHKEIFMQKAPWADDLWLKIMELYRGIPTVLCKTVSNNEIIEESKETALYLNQNANGGNDAQWSSLLGAYDNCFGEKGLLLRRLFSDGRLNVSEYKIEKKMKQEYEIKRKNEKIVDEFLRTSIGQEAILIYGAGNVAMRLYIVLEKAGYLEKIKAFIVENTEENMEKMGAIPVKNYKDFVGSTEKIIIGLWDSTQEEVYQVLIKGGISKERIIKLDLKTNEAIKNISFGIQEEFSGSAMYWQSRYLHGGNSGAGSYNRLAEFKADILNAFVIENKIELVLEWGCGDGNQLLLAQYPQYIGYDVAKEAVALCKTMFKEDKTNQFLWCGNESFCNRIKADLAISLDVIYHLVEDSVYQTYMERLFSSSNKFICIYSCDFEKKPASHVRCRKFTGYVEENYLEWELVKFIPNRYPYNESNPNNTSWSNFFFYKKKV